MSERSLQAMLDRVDKDKDFINKVRQDPVAALDEFSLSTVELFALTCGDEDALRRLAGSTEEIRMPAHHHMFRGAVLPAFNAQAAFEANPDGREAAEKTCSVTSQTVTTCCWGVEMEEA